MVLLRCLLHPSSPSPSCFPTEFVSAWRGSSAVRLSLSTGKKEIVDKKLSNVRSAGACRNNQYESITSPHFRRWSAKSFKLCANTELAPPGSSRPSGSLTKLMDFLKICYAFTRPYAAFGVIVTIVSSSLIAVERLSDISFHFLVNLLKTVAAFTCLSAYISGFNDLFDIEIDKINKPYLPLASGEMTIETGILIVSFFALMAFAIGIGIGSATLLWGMLLFFILLTAYSVKLPFLRWKSSAIGAAASMLSSFGIVLPVSTYLHMQTQVLGRQPNFPKALAFGTFSLILFMIVVALFKDIPDIEGDKKFGINSLATRLGQRKVFWICIYILEMLYASAIVIGATSSYPWSKLITVLSHAVLSIFLWNQAKSTDVTNQSAITSFYQFIFKLLYTECLLVTLIR